MKTKSLSMLVLLAMLLSIIMPITALAAEESNSEMTRGQFVAQLWEKAGSPKALAEYSFQDVSQKYETAVKWAVENGLVKGYSSEYFGGNDPITYEQIFTILHRVAAAADVEIISEEVKQLDLAFNNQTISDWAKGSIDWVCKQEIVTLSDEETEALNKPLRGAHIDKIIEAILNGINY